MANSDSLKPYLLVPLFDRVYQRKLVNLFGQSSVIALWPLTEASGSTAYDVSGNNRNGTYSGPTLANAAPPRGNKNVPLFDGVNDYVNVYSAGLNTAIDRTQGTILLWSRPYDASYWTSGLFKSSIVWTIDANNLLVMRGSSVNSQYQIYHRAGGTEKAVTLTSQSDVTWVNYGLTWSNPADQVKAYKNGAQQGSTQTGLGTLSGNFSDTKMTIGSNGTGPVQMHYGWMGYVLVLNRAATAAEILAAYNLR